MEGKDLNLSLNAIRCRSIWRFYRQQRGHLFPLYLLYFNLNKHCPKGVKEIILPFYDLWGKSFSMLPNCLFFSHILSSKDQYFYWSGSSGLLFVCCVRVSQLEEHSSAPGQGHLKGRFFFQCKECGLKCWILQLNHINEMLYSQEYE